MAWRAQKTDVFPSDCQANLKQTLGTLQIAEWELGVFPSSGLERISGYRKRNFVRGWPYRLRYVWLCQRKRCRGCEPETKLAIFQQPMNRQEEEEEGETKTSHLSQLRGNRRIHLGMGACMGISGKTLTAETASSSSSSSSSQGRLEEKVWAVRLCLCPQLVFSFLVRMEVW